MTPYLLALSYILAMGQQPSHLTMVNNLIHITPCHDPSGCVGREPLDVPAIQQTREEEYGNSDWCNACSSYGSEIVSCTSMACDPHAKHQVQHWTCADKSRILLVSEDGKTHHCLKFSQEKP